MALINGLTKLIEKELKGEKQSSPIACAEEVIYSGPLKVSNEIIIPRIGDLIQELTIKFDNVNAIGINGTFNSSFLFAYIETVNEHTNHNRHWPVRVFKTSAGFRIICDYEVNLLHPCQVTKLVLATDYNGCKHSVSITANYIFVGIDERSKLFLT